MAINPGYPLLRNTPLYLEGLSLSWLSNTTLFITPGNAKDFTDTNTILTTSGITINAALVGANGLDNGVLAADSYYAVYIIGDST